MMYDALMTELAADFWCIAPDTPGFGQSDALPGRASIGAYATAIADFLSELNVDACFLFGHHTGAAIAVQLAFDQPKLVTGVVLSGPPLLTEAQIEYLTTNLPSMELDADGRFLSDLWQRLRQKNPDVALELTLREVTAALQCRHSYHDAYHAVFAQEIATQLGALRCPVLLVAGENDSLVASLKPAARRVSNGRYKVIPDAGTYICDEQPHIVAQLLKDFLA